jgi:hypothetical protein
MSILGPVGVVWLLGASGHLIGRECWPVVLPLLEDWHGDVSFLLTIYMLKRYVTIEIGYGLNWMPSKKIC